MVGVRVPQVRSHLVADPDIRFGVFLSGGVDSSILAAILVEMGVPVQAFTVGMDDSRETDKVLADPNLATGPLYHIWAVELSEQTVNDLCLWPSCRHGWWHTGWASRRQSS